MNKGYVYIMTNKNRTVLYAGVTSDIMQRVAQHKYKIFSDSFTAKYNCNLLVYYQEFVSIIQAIEEEKRIKGGSRSKKELLINSMNPDWVDLAKDW